MTDARDSNTDRISEPTPLKPIVVSSTGRAADPTERDRVLPGCDRIPAKSMFSTSTGSRNEAEYRAFVAVLESLPEHSKAELFSDSLLLDSQFHGKYRVKDPDLAGLLGTAHELIRHRKLTVKLQWIPRAKNLAGTLL